MNENLRTLTENFDAYVAATLAANERKVEAVRRDGERLAARVVVGARMNVRLDRKTTVEGTVVSARLARVEQTPRTCYAVFAVELECGISKHHRTVHVQRIPTR